MNRAEARQFRLRWQRVTEVDRSAPETTPETRLRQLGVLLEIARRAGWPTGKPQAEIDEVRERWHRLRARLSGRPTR